MIVPGSANPLLMAQFGDPLDELGKIDRGLRSRAAVSPYLSWIPSGAGNRTVWTWFGWLKPAQVTEMVLFLAGGTSQNFSMLAMASSGALRTTTKISDVYSTDFYTDSLFRDPSGHCHIVINRNGTLNRVYSNGLLVGEITSSASNSFFNSVTTHYIGRRPFLSNSPVDGVLSHCGWVDGQALTPSAFGQFHPRTGQWRPKTKAAIRAAVAAGGGARNGWGANGFFLPFDDTTSLTTLGYDRSQSDTDTAGNNWTPTNISLTAGATYDSTLDTPTNVFCSINPLSSGATITNGGLTTYASANSPTYSSAIGTMSFSAGKWKYEFTNSGAGNGGQLGILPASVTNYVSGSWGTNATVLGDAGYGYSTDLATGRQRLNGSTVAGTAAAVGDVIRVEIDLDAWTIQWFKNDAPWGASASIAPGAYIPAWTGTGTTRGGDWNFGQRPFAHSGTTGFNSICTKNLPVKPPVMKSTDAFVAKTDSGANIVTTLSAAAPWPDWIRIFKRRDAAEGWRWQFSDDQGFYLDCSSTAAKAVFPALAGTSYMGYALRVGAQFGVATGRLSHVNGAADVVADGLGKSRKMIILKGEGAGGNWAVYHPELTAGKLVYLNGVAVETADATISAVNSSGFTVAAALASGTYRWIALAETDGFISLRSYVGNSSIDGPFYGASQQPGFIIEKGVTGSTANWNVHDTLRDPGNVADAALYTNLTVADDPSNPNVQLDINANGVKVRHFVSPYNVNGSKYISLMIGGFPFRYANAR